MENHMRTGKIPRRGSHEVDITSSLSGRRYKGTFGWRRMTIEDYGMAARMMNELTGGMKIVDDQQAAVLRSSVNLSIVIEDYPDWWEEIREIPDYGVILAVYSEYARWLESPFREERDKATRKLLEEAKRKLGYGGSDEQEGEKVDSV